jgi:6-pyruvoyltetrahydropterin/6-carboxytetrahydropterin synthase
MSMTLFRDFAFEAAHRNLTGGAGPTRSRLHGHSYRARVWLAGSIDDRLGWLIDFADIKSACSPVIEALDHRCLNEVDGMQEASLADVTRWLENRLGASLPGFAKCDVQIAGDTQFRPVVHPVSESGVRLETVGFWFSAAHFLPRLPESHKCRRLHGHSFRVEIASPDARTLLSRLDGLYHRLDHQFLNEISGLENPTSENLARWLWAELSATGSCPHEIAVQETCTTGCVYRGE